LEQTLFSIKSIREKAPKSLIILLENSELSETEISTLHQSTDWLISLSGNPQAIKLRDSEYKGAAETLMILQTQGLLSCLNYGKLFKLSGRYWLSDDFDMKNFVSDKLAFLPRDGVYSTRLYCVPKNLENLFFRQLKLTLSLTQKGKSVEEVILQGVSPDKVHHVKRLGVNGYIGPTGNLISE
jgi:hypothetical protein